MKPMSLSNLVLAALSCYFVFIIYRSNTKLTDGNIGTMFRTINIKSVQVSLSLLSTSKLLNDLYSYFSIRQLQYAYIRIFFIIGKMARSQAEIFSLTISLL